LPQSVAGDLELVGFERARVGAIRLHTDRSAAEFADTMGARALTYGSHIAFGTGKLGFAGSDGQQLLSHEAFHAARPMPVLSLDRKKARSQALEGQISDDELAKLTLTDVRILRQEFCAMNDHALEERVIKKQLNPRLRQLDPQGLYEGSCAEVLARNPLNNVTTDTNIIGVDPIAGEKLKKTKELAELRRTIEVQEKEHAKIKSAEAKVQEIFDAPENVFLAIKGLDSSTAELNEQLARKKQERDAFAAQFDRAEAEVHESRTREQLARLEFESFTRELPRLTQTHGLNAVPGLLQLGANLRTKHENAKQAFENEQMEHRLLHEQHVLAGHEIERIEHSLNAAAQERERLVGLAKRFHRKLYDKFRQNKLTDAEIQSLPAVGKLARAAHGSGLAVATAEREEKAWNDHVAQIEAQRPKSDPFASKGFYDMMDEWQLEREREALQAETRRREQATALAKAERERARATFEAAAPGEYKKYDTETKNIERSRSTIAANQPKLAAAAEKVDLKLDEVLRMEEQSLAGKLDEARAAQQQAEHDVPAAVANREQKQRERDAAQALVDSLRGNKKKRKQYQAALKKLTRAEKKLTKAKDAIPRSEENRLKAAHQVDAAKQELDAAIEARQGHAADPMTVSARDKCPESDKWNPANKEDARVNARLGCEWTVGAKDHKFKFDTGVNAGAGRVWTGKREYKITARTHKDAFGLAYGGNVKASAEAIRRVAQLFGDTATVNSITAGAMPILQGEGGLNSVATWDGAGVTVAGRTSGGRLQSMIEIALRWVHSQWLGDFFQSSTIKQLISLRDLVQMFPCPGLPMNMRYAIDQLEVMADILSDPAVMNAMAVAYLNDTIMMLIDKTKDDKGPKFFFDLDPAKRDPLKNMKAHPAVVGTALHNLLGDPYYPGMKMLEKANELYPHDCALDGSTPDTECLEALSQQVAFFLQVRALKKKDFNHTWFTIVWRGKVADFELFFKDVPNAFKYEAANEVLPGLGHTYKEPYKLEPEMKEGSVMRPVLSEKDKSTIGYVDLGNPKYWPE
jgi:hypothetical protein